MPTIRAKVSCRVRDSFRVQQVAGMFGLPPAQQSVKQFEVDVPGRNEDWQIGLIVGPSGSGKTTIAGRAFGDCVYAGAVWPDKHAVVDSFGDLSIRQVVELFTAVGFSSPPSWVKPYGALSNGERFRCDLARALARSWASGVGCQVSEKKTDTRNLKPSEHPLVVFDEFTSVVDRTVAKVCSAAIAKAIRRGSIPCRFVAVTCHYDVADWLEPDWVVDMSTCDLHRRCLRRESALWGRPPIELAIYRCHVDAWQLFKRHHYLSGDLPRGARCYLTTWDGRPVNFLATVPMVARRGYRRFARIVTLPDFQGIGIGMRAVAAVAALHRAEGHRVSVTSSHPALVRHCERSPLWRLTGIRKSDSRRRSVLVPKYRGAAGRTVVSFEYVGKKWTIPDFDFGLEA